MVIVNICILLILVSLEIIGVRHLYHGAEEWLACRKPFFLRLPQPEILEIKDLLMEPYISYGLKIIVLTLIISLKRGILFY